jgi:hypothetical protein
MRRTTIAVILVLLLGLALVGCTVDEPVVPEAPVADDGTLQPDTAEPEEPAEEAPAAEMELVEVPDVLGLRPDEAAELLEAAGLAALEVNVHGPIEPDAGDIGRVYRQTPAPGAMVEVGTAVELRSWWESQ